MQKKALETGISLYKGPVEDPEGASFSVDFERRVKEDWKRSVSLYGTCAWGEPGRWGP